MGYKCGSCGMEFPTKREIIEHMIDAHNSPFIEGDWAPLSDKILATKDKADTKKLVAFARGDERWAL